MKKPNYGIDAPGVIRNLFVAGGLGLLTVIGIFLEVIPRHLWIFDIWGMGIGFAIGCGGMGFFMLWDSKVGKLREREKLLDLASWRGDEQVLDIGCGRGLMLVGAAKRLTKGKAVGLDLWQQEDLSDNRPEATLENAQIEGVADRVEVKTGNMCQMPFAPQTFDLVVSCAAIHNLYKATDRAETMREISRILKSGGQVIISDIRHAQEYQAALRSAGLVEVKQVGSLLSMWFFRMITFGKLAPQVVVGRKP